MRRAGAALALAALLAGCLGAAEVPGPAAVPPRPPAEPALGAAVPAGHTAWDNGSLARLFVLLAFRTEWGAVRPVLLRYEGPVRVRAKGPGAERLAPFLHAYLGWLRDRTGIDIAPGAEGANLHVVPVPGRAFARLLPGAACVMVPGRPGWRAFAADPGGLGGRALERLSALTEMTVFLPDTAAPAEARACLMEEIAQALGPVNDLDGLGPSIFNDDFGHIWPTRLDLLMLRVIYDPALRTGMGERAAARAALAVLDRINPAGRAAPPLPPLTPPGAAAWRREVARVLTRDADEAERIAAAGRALEQARAALPGTAWHCRSLVLRAQAEKSADPAAALARFDEAARVCRAVHGAGDPRLSLVALARAGVLAALDRPGEALAGTDGLETALAAHGREAALAALYGLRAQAFAAMDRGAEAEAEARRAAAWSAWALGRAGPGS